MVAKLALAEAAGVGMAPFSRRVGVLATSAMAALLAVANPTWQQVLMRSPTTDDICTRDPSRGALMAGAAGGVERVGMAKRSGTVEVAEVAAVVDRLTVTAGVTRRLLSIPGKVARALLAAQQIGAGRPAAALLSDYRLSAAVSRRPGGSGQATHRAWESRLMGLAPV